MKIGIKILAIFFALYSSAVLAIAYDIRVIAGGMGPGSSYAFDTLSVQSWDVNDNSLNPMWEGNPNSGWQATNDNLSFFYNDWYETGSWTSSGDYIVPGARKAKTMGELGKLFIAQGYLGEMRSFRRDSRWHKRSCYQLGYFKKNGTARLDSKCFSSEVPPTVCWVEEPYIEINHGVLAPAEVNGNSAYTDFHVTCSAGMSVVISSQARMSSVTLYSVNRNWLLSDLMINDNKLGDGVQISASTSPTRLRLSSTLSGYDTQSVGEFSGSLPIIIAVP